MHSCDSAGEVLLLFALCGRKGTEASCGDAGKSKCGSTACIYAGTVHVTRDNPPTEEPRYEEQVIVLEDLGHGKKSWQ